jgi:hypothetical protein
MFTRFSSRLSSTGEISLPKSRKRNRRRHPSSKVASTRSKSNSTLRILVIVFVVGVFIAGAVFVFSGGKTNSPGSEVATPSGLKYIDEVVGTGESPKLGSAVTVHYTGTLLNGTKFDSSVDRNQPYTFRIGAGTVIKGWDEGIMTMKVGGKRRLIIPPELAYGARGRGPEIPPNSTLVFEVELLDVK